MEKPLESPVVQEDEKEIPLNIRITPIYQPKFDHKFLSPTLDMYFYKILSY